MSDEIYFAELVPPTGRGANPLHEVINEPRMAFGGRSWVYSNMVTSLDGGVAIDGVSSALGGPADKAVFDALRSVADVILVGATTVIDENYRPPSDRHRADRLDRGQRPRPTIAIITRSLSIEPTHRVFGDPSARPLIITTTDAPKDRRAALEPVADFIEAGTGDVDLELALGRLHAGGFERALLEGGPTINGQFIANDLVDEWNLSLAPDLVGGESPRSAHGPHPSTARSFDLTRLWLADGMLFGRWVRAVPGRQ